METKQFLQRVLGDGFYCVLALGKDRRIQKFYSSVDEVINSANSLDEQGYDTYFGLATFETGESRKVPNVKSLSSFFLDLDCGVGKDYESQNLAVKDLRAFCDKLNLPKPIMVNSGYGVHVYWVLQESVAYDEWLPVAQALKDKCTQHKLLADIAVTADAARVLRIPNTHNHKKGLLKPCLLYTSPSPRDGLLSRMPSSA